MAQLGSMPPLEQMKAYALREVVQSLDVHIPNSRKGKVPYQWIADRVQVYTGDRTVQRPERDAVRGRVNGMHSPSGADAVLQCYDLAPWPVKAAGPGSCTHTLSFLIL